MGMCSNKMRQWFWPLATAVALQISPAVSQAGCYVSVGVKNQNPHPVSVIVRSSVKTKGGSWRSLQHGGWGPNGDPFYHEVAAGATYKDTYQAVLGCDKNRRYRIRYKCAGDSHITQYYPSANGWTKEQTFVLRLNGC